MSSQQAAAVVSRLSMNVAFMSPQYGGLATDLQELSRSPVSPDPQAIVRRSDDLCSAYGMGPAVREKVFAFYEGVAIIPVHGTLINRYSYGWSFLTGYAYIRAQMNAALDDDDVKLIVFDVNSYGGEAAGCFELADEILEARSRKSLLAVVDSNCCSAAYAIASACSKIIVTPSGQAGSIGVIALHVSQQKMLEEWGLEVTIMSSFEHKADANPYKKLPASVQKDLEAQIEKRALEFVSLVARNRNLSEDLVRGTESRTFRADEALQLRLIDSIQPPSKAVAAFFGELGGEEPGDQGDQDMTTQAAAPAPAAPAAEATAPAPAAASAPVDVNAAVASALAAERTRASGIRRLDEAKGQDDLAQFCIDQGMSIEDAKACLAAAQAGKAAPAETPKAGADGKTVTPAAAGGGQQSPFKAAMDASGHPEVGADADSGENGGDAPLKGQAFVSSVLDGMYGKRPTANA